jgi:uncharacterized protein YbcI
MEGQRQYGPADPDPPGKDVVQATEAQVAEGIRRDILAIQRESYGRGADRAQAFVMDDTVIVLLDGLELLPNEEFLIENGREETVTNLRYQFQQAIESTFRAAVERATGRRVVGFASHFELKETPFAVEIFRLEPT